MTQNRFHRFGKPAALLATGLVAGGILAGGLTAYAADAVPSPSAAASAMSGRGHADEQALTGDSKAKVEAAVLAAYPGATIERSETDSDGTYEAHIVTADDQTLTVLVNDAFAVTGTESHGDR